MLHQQDVATFITEQMPEVKKDLSTAHGVPTAFTAIQALTDHTKRMAFQHDFVGLFAFSSILPRCNQPEWQLVQSCMPPDLYTLYVRQVLRSTC